MKKIFFVLFFISICSYASRPAKVIVREAKLYEFPDESSPVLKKLNLEQYVAISNFDIKNFYKVRTADGQIGWVLTSSLIVYNYDGSIASKDQLNKVPKSSKKLKKGFSEFLGKFESKKTTHSFFDNLESKDSSYVNDKNIVNSKSTDSKTDKKEENKKINVSTLKEKSGDKFYSGMRVTLIRGMSFFEAKDFNTLIGEDILKESAHNELDINYPYSDKIGFSLNFGFISGKSIVSKGTDKTTLKLSSIPIMLGANYKVYEKKYYRSRVGLFAGKAFNTKISVKSVTEDSNSSIDLEKSDLFFSLQSLNYLVLPKNISILVRLGYQFFLSGKIDIVDESINSSEFSDIREKITKTPILLSGGLFSLGICYTF